MKTISLAPQLARRFPPGSPEVIDIGSAIDHLGGRSRARGERIAGRNVYRVYANGHRILYRESSTRITILCVRPTVRRRWDALLS